MSACCGFVPATRPSWQTLVSISDSLVRAGFLRCTGSNWGGRWYYRKRSHGFCWHRHCAIRAVAQGNAGTAHLAQTQWQKSRSTAARSHLLQHQGAGADAGTGVTLADPVRGVLGMHLHSVHRQSRHLIPGEPGSGDAAGPGSSYRRSVQRSLRHCVVRFLLLLRFGFSVSRAGLRSRISAGVRHRPNNCAIKPVG